MYSFQMLWWKSLFLAYNQKERKLEKKADDIDCERLAQYTRKMGTFMLNIELYIPFETQQIAKF